NRSSTDSQVCRKDHWWQPAHHPRPVHLQSQETGRKNHCRPLTPRTQPISTSPLWYALPNTVRQNLQTQKQFLPPSRLTNEQLIHCGTVQLPWITKTTTVQLQLQIIFIIFIYFISNLEICAIHSTPYCVTIQAVNTVLLTSFSYHLILIPALLALSTLCTTCCVYSSQLLYIAIPPCIYFLYFSDRCAVVLYCFVLCSMFCVSTMRATLPSQIPCLCKLTWPIKPDSDSDSDVEAGKRPKSTATFQL